MMLDTIDVTFHGKRHTDFDLKRIIKAQEQGFDVPVTAYLCGVSIRSRAGIGVVFGHKRKDQYGRFGDGHLIRTSDVLKSNARGGFGYDDRELAVRTCNVPEGQWASLPA